MQMSSHTDIQVHLPGSLRPKEILLLNFVSDINRKHSTQTLLKIINTRLHSQRCIGKNVLWFQIIALVKDEGNRDEVGKEGRK